MAGATQALKTAVHQNPLATLQGVQQRMFSAWFNSFIYNQIWEDPEVDLEALALTGDSEVLTISSGGCNIFNYLTASPARIVAVDLNPYHLSLARLKLAGMHYLPDHASFYDFFGHADKTTNVTNFERYIKHHLDDELQHFWSSPGLLRKARIRMFADGFYRHTRFGYFMRFLHYIADRTDYRPESILQATSLAEQRKIFEREIRPFFNNRIVKTLSRLPVSVFSLGIPPQQYEAMKREGNLVQQFCERVERIACDFPIQDNYFAWQGFSHSYDHEQRLAVPAYLKAENFDLIRNQLHKVETHLGSMIDYLAAQPAESLDRFVFLDAQDWMSDEVLVSLWQQVLRVGRPGSRIIFRTAAADSPLTHALPETMQQQLDYHQEASQAGFRRDRSAIYGGFHLYQIR